jgi:glycosyltransferase involved in cell wall biosynthesis
MLGRAVRRVVAQSRDEIGELLRIGVPATRISLVPSGVDLDRFTPRGPAVPRDGRPRILSVGRLVERKGFADLVQAMAAVPQAECVVIGGPAAVELPADPVARRLRTLARACGVDDRVRLAGAVPGPEMPRWYRSADLLACAPWYEPFGLTPLEAMACGVPVVATAVGGLTDTVVDRVTGRLVHPRDPRGLGTALGELLGDPPARLACAAAALARARHRYSWWRTATALQAIYRSVAPAAAVPDRDDRVAVGS